MERTSLATASISIVSTKSQAKQPILSTQAIDTSTTAKLANPDEQVRTVGIHEYKEAALSLAESFKYDHTTEYFCNCPDTVHWSEAQKWDLHVSMMEYITYAHCLKGLVTTVGPNYGAVALWYVYVSIYPSIPMKV